VGVFELRDHPLDNGVVPVVAGTGLVACMDGVGGFGVEVAREFLKGLLHRRVEVVVIQFQGQVLDFICLDLCLLFLGRYFLSVGPDHPPRQSARTDHRNRFHAKRLRAHH